MHKIFVNTHEAKTNLSKLLRQVEAGHEVIISRAGKPVGKLSIFDDSEPPKKRQFGGLKGKIFYADDWEKTHDDIMDIVLNGSIFPDDK